LPLAVVGLVAVAAAVMVAVLLMCCPANRAHVQCAVM
jgi:hypothetical protein